MSIQENKSFRVGQAGVPLPPEFRQSISDGMKSMSPEAQALRRDRISQTILNGSPEALAARVSAMHNLSPEADKARRAKASATRAGWRQPQEVVKGMSTVWSRTGPFHARGGSVPEVADITGLNKSQVKSALSKNRLRPEWQQIDVPKDPELTKERRRLSQLRRHHGVGIPQQDLEKMHRLVNLFAQEGFFAMDIVVWNQLIAAYESAGRNLPQNLADKIRLEVFMAARLSASQGNLGPLIRYKELGDSVDSKWFGNLSGEEKFVAAYLSGEVLLADPSPDCTHRWVIGQSGGERVIGHCRGCGGQKEFQGKYKEPQKSSVLGRHRKPGKKISA